MTMLSPVISLEPRTLVIRIVLGVLKLATPVRTSMPLRESCAVVTSISVLMTCWTRKAKSAMEIFSLTR